MWVCQEGRSYEHLAPKQAQLGKIKIYGYTLTVKTLIVLDTVINTIIKSRGLYSKPNAWHV